MILKKRKKSVLLDTVSIKAEEINTNEIKNITAAMAVVIVRDVWINATYVVRDLDNKVVMITKPSNGRHHVAEVVYVSTISKYRLRMILSLVFVDYVFSK